VLSYDVDNRLASVTAGSGAYGAVTPVSYGYGPDNKRILKTEAWDGTSAAETRVYFHGLGGERLGEWRLNFNGSGTTLSVDLVSGNTWFGGRLIKEGDWRVVQDAKGSVRWRKNVVTGVTEVADYYPFGSEKPAATANGRQKFGTYGRDSETGLDYADQRYFASVSGRFMTADPYQASGGVADPGSWNRYAYVEGDPVNYSDPAGLETCGNPCNVTAPDPGPPSWLCDPENWSVYCQQLTAGSWSPGLQPAVTPLEPEALTPMYQGLAQQAVSTMSDECWETLSSYWNLAGGPASLMWKVGNITFLQEGEVGHRLMSEFGYGGGDGLLTVSEYFERENAISFVNKDVDGGHSYAGSAVILGSRFFSSQLSGVPDYLMQEFQFSVLLHEVFHSYTGLDDISLANTLGLGGDTPYGYGQPGQAAAASGALNGFFSKCF
jgi:RHS repeat-associated protein